MVKRYDPEISRLPYECSDSAVMEEFSGDDYVTYSDYQKLADSHAELVGQIDATIDSLEFLAGSSIKPLNTYDILGRHVVRLRAALDKAIAVGSEDSETVRRIEE